MVRDEVRAELVEGELARELDERGDALDRELHARRDARARERAQREDGREVGERHHARVAVARARVALVRGSLFFRRIRQFGVECLKLLPSLPSLVFRDRDLRSFLERPHEFTEELSLALNCRNCVSRERLQQMRKALDERAPDVLEGEFEAGPDADE